MSAALETVVLTRAKSYLTSKTLWTNVLMTPAALWLAKHNVVLDPATQAQIVAAIIVGVNLVLRKLTTGPVSMTTHATMVPVVTPVALPPTQA